MLDIETGRLRLVPCTITDAKAAIRDRPALAERLGVRVPEDWPAEDLRGFLPIYTHIVNEQDALQGWGIWLMISQTDNALVGDIGFKGKPDQFGMVEVGYSVLPAFQNQGYASEAARALLEWGFTQPGVSQIVANCHETNQASIRVLQKAGMQQIGRDRDELLWKMRSGDLRRSRNVQPNA